MTSTELTLAGMGLGLGCIHVLTGPDHLSALATLSANVDNLWNAFHLGVRWGYGHTTGLLAVAGVFLVLSGLRSGYHVEVTGTNDEKFEIPERVTQCFEALIGIFLLVIGVHGLLRAWGNRYMTKTKTTTTTTETTLLKAELLQTDEEDQRDSYECDENSILVTTNDYGSCDNPCETCTLLTAPLPTKTQSSSSASSEDIVRTCNLNSYHDHSHGHNQNYTELVTPPEISSSSLDTEYPSTNVYDHKTLTGGKSHDHNPIHGHHHACHGGNDAKSSVSTKTMAFATGIVHGLAGPGGVLGILPAIQLHNVRLATIYLSCFCFSSIITMGIFATAYGYLSHRIAKTPDRAFLVEFLSAWFSVIVGLLWLILLYKGTLDDIFS